MLASIASVIGTAETHALVALAAAHAVRGARRDRAVFAGKPGVADAARIDAEACRIGKRA